MRDGKTAGSSPLARGLRRGLCLGARRAGIIPARAGFTPGHGGEGHGRRDHPRSRGVYADVARLLGYRDGSSPLARGLRGGPGGVDDLAGIIPARAGFTDVEEGLDLFVGDHPRSRGVYLSWASWFCQNRGSSPLARGLPVDWDDAGRVTRIIPARAGFTAFEASADGKGTDHPRSRGVYRSWLQCSFSVPGSSPLARGLREALTVAHGDGRIIPARAGFTVHRLRPGL